MYFFCFLLVLFASPLFTFLLGDAPRVAALVFAMDTFLNTLPEAYLREKHQLREKTKHVFNISAGTL